MARISSYPIDSTIQDKDSWIGTESTNRVTRNFTAEDIANYVVTSTSGITGSGTFNTVPLWTPDGTKLGDSIITQAASGQGVTVTGQLNVTEDFYVTGSTQLNGALTVEGVSTFNDDVECSNSVTVQGIFTADGNSVFEGQANFQSSVTDQTSNPGTAGQVLVSTGTNVQWTDSTDVVSGSVAVLIPYLTTATPGGSETYNELNNIVKIGWSGGNGIYVINLPSATTIPYRVIRFVTNGTYPGGGSHKVRFTAAGTETIDGAAFFEISKVYEGLSIWSTGTEWVVIQAKAH
mgnify:FL=1|jgi:hypothetical protein